MPEKVQRPFIKLNIWNLAHFLYLDLIFRLTKSIEIVCNNYIIESITSVCYIVCSFWSITLLFITYQFFFFLFFFCRFAVFGVVWHNQAHQMKFWWKCTTHTLSFLRKWFLTLIDCRQRVMSPIFIPSSYSSYRINWLREGVTVCYIEILIKT